MFSFTVLGKKTHFFFNHNFGEKNYYKICLIPFVLRQIKKEGRHKFCLLWFSVATGS